MMRIKINDLPKDRKITKDELKNVTGGALTYMPVVTVKPTLQTDFKISEGKLDRYEGWPCKW